MVWLECLQRRDGQLASLGPLPASPAGGPCTDSPVTAYASTLPASSVMRIAAASSTRTRARSANPWAGRPPVRPTSDHPSLDSLSYENNAWQLSEWKQDARYRPSDSHAGRYYSSAKQAAAVAVSASTCPDIVVRGRLSPLSKRRPIEQAWLRRGRSCASAYVMLAP